MAVITKDKERKTCAELFFTESTNQLPGDYDVDYLVLHRGDKPMLWPVIIDHEKEYIGIEMNGDYQILGERALRKEMNKGD